MLHDRSVIYLFIQYTKAFEMPREPDQGQWILPVPNASTQIKQKQQIHNLIIFEYSK